MGAHAAGELASEMATSQIAQHYSRLAETSSIKNALHDAISRANSDIFSRGQSNPEFYNMGTTACALVISSQGALIGHVGDSRVYRIRGKSLEQMTSDHSLVWELQAGGQLTEEGVANIPKNVITRSLGPGEDVQIDIEGPMDVQAGDRFLLCSDGLTGPVSDEEIAVLAHCLEEQVAARVLVDLANLRGGPDNISIIIINVTKSLDPTADRKTKSSQDPSKWYASLCVAGVGIFAAAVFAAMGETGLLIGAVVVAIVAGIFASTLRDSTINDDAPARQMPSGGKAPYRRYPVLATSAMVHRFGQTIDQLCEAAKDRGWLLDQTRIDQLRQNCRAEVDRSNWQRAIEYQSEAITEAMNQLRRQRSHRPVD